ncbi:hypothetical protein SNE35_21330 [Paucibacter sp. R3-3]|uniref:Uncharacterized protein n=1 Tax=Roseateles agri TaxID=3098619 RepID=A0ABU5DL84_9BURK|nr:hypothetical protein [Paucibacter sp. R3-3]MDY0747064.1 hypothetical protein [Paucibacter sp. R3-3]
MRIAVFLLAVLLLPLGRAQAADAERRELQQQRQAVETRFKAESQACRQEFFVNTCLDRIRNERLAALRPLQARELQLGEADRKARSEEQTRRVAERQREFAAEEGRRRTEALQQQSPGSPADAGGKQHTSPAAARSLPVDPQTHARDITRQSEEAAQAAARTREQAGKRQRVVLQHQEDFQRRQEERAASTRKPGQPLPIPSAADIAAAASAAGKR